MQNHSGGSSLLLEVKAAPPPFHDLVPVSTPTDNLAFHKSNKEGMLLVPECKPTYFTPIVFADMAILVYKQLKYRSGAGVNLHIHVPCFPWP